MRQLQLHGHYQNLVFHAHSIHIEIQYHYVHELNEDEEVEMVYSSLSYKAEWSGYLHQGTREGSCFKLIFKDSALGQEGSSPTGGH